MRSLCDTIGGLFALFMLAARSGFIVKSSYWRWRNETAFGSGSLRRPPLVQRLRAMLEYGRWVHRMKRRL